MGMGTSSNSITILLLWLGTQRASGWTSPKRSFRRSCNLILSLSNPWESEDLGKFPGDDEMSIDNPGDLQRILRGIDNAPYQKKSNLDAETIAELENITQQSWREEGAQSADTKISDIEEKLISNNDDDHSFFLSEDDYLRASGMVNPDGTLPPDVFAPGGEEFELKSNANEPKEDDDELTKEDLTAALKRQQGFSTDEDARRANELRNQMFSQEKAFSSLYVESDEYKLYENIVFYDRDDEGQDDDGSVDLALEGLQKLIDSKKSNSSGGEGSPQTIQQDDLPMDNPIEEL